MVKRVAAIVESSDLRLNTVFVASIRSAVRLKISCKLHVKGRKAKTPQLVMLNLFQHLAPKSRWALWGAVLGPSSKSEDPSFGEQLQVACSKLQAEVLRKNVKCRHSDKAFGQNLDALASSL